MISPHEMDNPYYEEEPGVYVIRMRHVVVCIPCDEKDHENCYGERCQCCTRG